MSKRAVKSQASSARAASGAFGGAFGQIQGPFRSSSTIFGSVPSSSLSYVYEPPDLTGISDPNVIVAFKNVQKKDSTTKTKALEDLQSHVDSSGQNDVEEGILDAWVRSLERFFKSQIVINIAFSRSGCILALLLTALVECDSLLISSKGGLPHHVANV